MSTASKVVLDGRASESFTHLRVASVSKKLRELVAQAA
jgi:hypothetical protein